VTGGERGMDRVSRSPPSLFAAQKSGSLSSRAEACLCLNVISDITEGASPFPTFDKQIYGEKNNVILSKTKDLKNVKILRSRSE